MAATDPRDARIRELQAMGAAMIELTDNAEVIADRMEAEQIDLGHELRPLQQQMLAMLEHALEVPDLRPDTRQALMEHKRHILEYLTTI